MSESTVVCFDNSEWMRNGDFRPSRLQQQIEAANMVVRAKTMAHPESTVALISMADKVDVVTSHTNDRDKVVTSVLGMQPCGSSKFLNAIRTARLALKHRQNRQARSRIVMFVGSPMDDVPQEEFVKLGKMLKKEKVQMDVVLFGEANSENGVKCEAFLNAINGAQGTGSHLIVVPSGSGLNDALSSSAILRREDGTNPAAGGGGMDMDAEADPELAMALRVSLEEQRQRQEQQGPPAMEEGTVAPGAMPQPVATNPEAMTEEEQLAYALTMSMQAEAAGGAAASASSATAEAMDEGVDEIDPAQLEAMLADLPGVNPQSAAVRQAVQQAVNQQSTTQPVALSEEQQMAMALQMSMQSDKKEDKKADSKDDTKK